MHQNFYFLRQLTSSLAPQIVGLKWIECFSQERDELIIVLAEARGKHNFYKPFFIRVSLRPDFTCLNFPDEFSRARQNSVNLFESLNDLTVLSIRQFENERAFGIELAQNHWVVFKLFGNRSNIVIFQDGQVTDLFQNKLAADQQLKLETLDKKIDQSWEAFMQANHDHRKLFPTFGKELNAFYEEKTATLTRPEEKWQVIESMLKQLQQPRFYITNYDYQTAFTLLPMGEIVREHTNSVEAINDFYISYLKVNVLDREKGDILRVLQKKIQRTENYIKETKQKLNGIGSGPQNEEIGHILMANLHQIPERAESVELFDFYRNNNIVIKIKPDLSPQKNAENFYRKAKNERIEIEKLEENFALRATESLQYQLHLEAIEALENVRELRKYLKKEQLLTEKPVLTPTQLFKHTTCDGFVILIGKNAKNNDLLTKQYAYKEDLWLHARDVAGSHVIIKYKAGKKFSNQVIERAAQLAAWFSKRRNETLCPVIVIPRKFVRKPKGLADGEVVLDKEEVIMVEPMGLQEL